MRPSDNKALRGPSINWSKRFLIISKRQKTTAQSGTCFSHISKIHGVSIIKTTAKNVKRKNDNLLVVKEYFNNDAISFAPAFFPITGFMADLRLTEKTIS